MTTRIYQADSALFVPFQFALTNLNNDAPNWRSMKQDAAQILDSGAKIRSALQQDMPCSSGLILKRDLRLKAVRHWMNAADVLTNVSDDGSNAAQYHDPFFRELNAGTAAWDEAKQ